MAIGTSGSSFFIGSGDQDGRFQLWDEETGAPIGRLTKPGPSHVNAIAAAEIGGWTSSLQGRRGGGTPVISADDKSELRLWDMAAGTDFGCPETLRMPIEQVAVGRLDGLDVAAVASGHCVSWYSRKEERLVHLGTYCHSGIVRAVTFAQLDGRTILASGSDAGDVVFRVADESENGSSRPISATASSPLRRPAPG